MAKISALSKAFEKAFAHTASKETLDDLLECLGQELVCDRISVFELISDGTISNSHEWCREGIETERDLLQHIPIAALDSWRERLRQDETIYINSLESTKERDPDVYNLFYGQGIQSLVVARLAFHGKNLGFFVLENPAGNMQEDMELVLPGMRYILSSLVYSDGLVHHLEKLGYTDVLTGTGNRASLQEHLERLHPETSKGVIYLDILGWAEEDERLEHLREEQEYIRAGEVLLNLYEDAEVYRVATHEFLVVLDGMTKESFDGSLSVLRSLLYEHDLLAATGAVWADHLEDSFDSLIRRAHLSVYNDRKAIVESRGHKKHQFGEVWDKKDRAKIPLTKGDAFFRQAEDFLSELFDTPVLTAVLDINYFKLFNDIFGRKAGNLFLEKIADELEHCAGKNNGIAGYLGGDNFCVVMPVSDTSGEALKPCIERLLEDIEYTDGFAPAIGIYISDDRQETMIGMYDRALTALQEIKGSYFEHYRFYNAEHFQHVRDDKILLMDIKEALKNREFIFYVQPQVDGNTGKIIGGEALIRWQHGEQLISPGRFIPVLEKTGYIFAVDSYLWEEVVKWMRSLMDRGIEPIPCSVNVSRVDFFFTDIAEHFKTLLDKYDVPARYIGVEITESAFTDNADSIFEAVNKLHEMGFRVLMDDFGSGSSSLSMLHTMNFDVIKTDVNFMSKKDADSKAISIVEAVVSMAHMIGMLVITEGVETENQRQNLIALGDNFVQGFYFYRPMPVPEFEKLLIDTSLRGAAPQNTDIMKSTHLQFRDFIRKGMVSETLLDNIIGPAAIFREQFIDGRGSFSILQMNEHFAEVVGIRPGDTDSYDRVVAHYTESVETGLADIFHGANRHPLEGAAGLIKYRKEGELLELEMRVFLLYSCDDHRLYLTTMERHRS